MGDGLISPTSRVPFAPPCSIPCSIPCSPPCSNQQGVVGKAAGALSVLCGSPCQRRRFLDRFLDRILDRFLDRILDRLLGSFSLRSSDFLYLSDLSMNLPWPVENPVEIEPFDRVRFDPVSENKKIICQAQKEGPPGSRYTLDMPSIRPQYSLDVTSICPRWAFDRP